MGSKPKQSAASKELEKSSIEREKQLRVENARQTTKAFSDNIAFRKKLRGIFSLLSNGFKGFPGKLGSQGLGAGAGGGGSGGGGGGGGASPVTGVGSQGGGPAGGSSSSSSSTTRRTRGGPRR